MNFYNDHEIYVANWLSNLVEAGALPAGDVSSEDFCGLDHQALSDYTQVHLFAGIGGWPLALRLAGWPDDVPVWTASLPCQPFSQAGRQRGKADSRHLWPAVREAVEVCRPGVCFGEQVASPLGRDWMSTVRADLEDLGYEVGIGDLCAAGVGAPHIRQRLYWVAYSHDDAEGLVPRGGGAVRGGRADGAARTGPRGCLPDGWLGHADEPGLEGRGERRRGPGEWPAWATGGWGRVVVAEGYLQGSPDGGESPGEAEGGRSEPSGHGRTGGGLGDPDDQVPALEGPHGRAGSEAREEVEAGLPSIILVPCLDGKARPIEPGVLPVAHRLPADVGWDGPGEASPFRVIRDPETGRSIGQSPWRIGMIRAYGNAIVPQVAAIFITAFMEAISERVTR